ncbi:MAG: hypothetical protein AAF742_00765, partial [Pseudomonadota bacterium]
FAEHLDEILKIASVYKDLDERDDGASVPVQGKEWNGNFHFCDPGLGGNFRVILEALEKNTNSYREAAEDFRKNIITHNGQIINLAAALANQQNQKTVSTINQLQDIFSDNQIQETSQVLSAFNDRIRDISVKFNRLDEEVVKELPDFSFCGEGVSSSEGCVATLADSCEKINQAFRVLTLDGQISVSLDDEAVEPSSTAIDCSLISLDTNDNQSIAAVSEAEGEVEAIFQKLGEQDFFDRKSEAQVRLEDARELAQHPAFRAQANQLQTDTLNTSLAISKLQALPSVRRSWDLLIDDGYVPFVEGAANRSEEAASALEGTGNRADIMDDAAFFLAVGIDGMIVVLAVLIAYMKSGPTVRIVRDLEGRISHDTLSAAHANIAREDPAIFSKISHFSRSVSDRTYPFVLELDSFGDINARRRAERVLGLLGPHAVLSGSDDTAYQLTIVAKAYIDSLAGNESEYVNLTEGLGRTGSK